MTWSTQRSEAPDQAPGTHRASGKTSHARSLGGGFGIKLALVGLINALGVYGVFLAIEAQHTVLTIVVIAIFVVVDVVYFVPTRRLLPLKYLVPGLIFLLVYQIFVIGYTAYTAFTNYGDGHNAGQDAAVSAILREHETRVPDSPSTPVSVIEGDAGFGLAYVDDAGTVYVGFAEQPFAPVEGADVTRGKVTALPDAKVLAFKDISRNARDITALRIPVSDDPNDGSLRTDDGSRAYLARSPLIYDEAQQTLVNTATGAVYRPNDTGNFESADGEVLTPGWKVNVGWTNFTAIFTGGKLSTEFFGVLAWTVIFALLSVVTTFALGLGLALLFHHDRMRGKRTYRALMILPYAFPGFLSALVWGGMLNQEHGFINNVLLFGIKVPWLLDPWWARAAVLGVNLWLGFPYMFLICLGALQSIDRNLYEAARVDGASAWTQLRSITLPMLMVATAPLLISSFAFNFNNFNLIYLMTGGGPKDLTSTTGTGVGATDILVTYTYKVAFSGGLQQHGLASAISIMIFLIVAVVSVIGFRRTRTLEELH